MMKMKSSLKVLLLLVVTCVVQTAYSAPLFIDASVDLTRLKIADTNAVGDGAIDCSAPVQAAIDYLAKNPEGGSLIFGLGVYRVGGLVVKPGVKVIGADRQQTIFRATNPAIVFDMQGGELHNFTVYGTPDAASSGKFWKVGTGGVGKGGTAKAVHLIRVGNSPKLIAKDVVISNVTAKEARYDCLYTRGSQNLRVLDCEFDRAGRNVVSMVGNDENFLISNCRFGSLWGLYHVDIEPNKGHYVRDGEFLNCEFDGSHAGDMKTDTWGAMLTFSGVENLGDRNISVIGCTFRDISIRVRGIFPDVYFLYNPQLGKFVKVRTNSTGELRDATIRGNHFGTPQKPMKNISAGVTFTGKSTFEGNTPAAANDTKITSESHDAQWKEDHPLAVKHEAAAMQTPQKAVLKPDPKGGQVATIPLMGHRFDFATNTISGNKDTSNADVIFHIDPLIAIGNAGLKVLSSADLKADGDSLAKLSNVKYDKELWGVKTGDTIAVKTNAGRFVVMRILDQQKDKYTIQYRFMK